MLASIVTRRRSIAGFCIAALACAGAVAPAAAQSDDVNQAINNAMHAAKSLDAVTDVRVDLVSSAHGSYDCGGHNARIAGGQSVVSLSHCKTVAIDGGHNSVTVHGASSIRILGSNNAVKWSGSDKPVIDNRGSDNNIVKL